MQPAKNLNMPVSAESFRTGRVLSRKAPVLEIPSLIAHGSSPTQEVALSEVNLVTPPESGVLPVGERTGERREERNGERSGVLDTIFRRVVSLVIVTSGFAVVGVAMGLVLRFLVAPISTADGAKVRAIDAALPREQMVLTQMAQRADREVIEADDEEEEEDDDSAPFDVAAMLPPPPQPEGAGAESSVHREMLARATAKSGTSRRGVSSPTHAHGKKHSGKKGRGKGKRGKSHKKK